jgi:hypothetical protein
MSLIKGKAKFHYEYGTAGKISVGGIVAGYFGLYPGVRVQAFGRYYITDDALTGLYVQPKFHVSANTFSYTVGLYDQNNNYTEEKVTENISELGGSLNIGWQFLLGSNENIVLDFFTGYRFSSLHGKNYDNLIIDNDGSDSGTEALYAILHSSRFDLGMSFGYKF